MSASTLTDRILVALASEPMSEQDFAVTFPKTSREALRTKLGELRKLGKIVERDGVFSIPRGQSVAPETLKRVEAEQRAATVEQATTTAVAVKAAAAQRRSKPAPEPEPQRLKECKRCHEPKPLHEFAKMAKASDGLYPWCRQCSTEYRADLKRRKSEDEQLAEPEPSRHVRVEVVGSLTEDAGAAIARELAKQVKDRDVVILDPPAPPAAPAAVEATPAPTPAPADSGNVLPFPGTKTLEDIVAKHTAPPGVIVQTLRRIVFRDPETGAPHALLLSEAGVKLPRDALSA